MAGFDDPEVVQKAIETRRAKALARENTTLDQVVEQIAKTRLEFIRELAGLDPKKLSKRYFSILMGTDTVTREEASLWRDFMATMLPTLTSAENKGGAGDGETSGVFINIQPPAAAEVKPAIEVTATKGRT